MKRMAAWLPALAWMGVIYLMSALPGEVSGEQSGRLVSLVMKAVCCFAGEEAAAQISVETLHVLIRKAAHMAEYAVLFALYRYALVRNGVRRPGAWALMLCVLYAATDEWHQSFVDSRGPAIADVGIDALGAAIAWGMLSIVNRIKRKERR